MKTPTIFKALVIIIGVSINILLYCIYSAIGNTGRYEMTGNNIVIDTKTGAIYHYYPPGSKYFKLDKNNKMVFIDKLPE